MSRYNREELFERAQDHLQKLNNSEVDELDGELIEDLISLATIDRSIDQDQKSIKSLLAATVKILYKTDLDIDFNLLIELLDAILSHLDFETVINVFQFESIVEALNSPNQNLQILALKVSSKANPPDIISNTEIIPKAINLLSTAGSSIRLVNEIEKMIGTLVRGELIRRRLLSEGVESILLKMKNSKNTELKSRLLNIVTLILPFVQEHELSKEFYCFTDFLADNDILYTLNLIQFYNEILDIVDSTLNKSWLLENTSPQAEIIGKLYASRTENTDIEHFAQIEISLFFKKLSKISPEIFSPIDKSYIQLKSSDTFLLASLDPGYLAISHPNLLKTIDVSVATVPILRNLISDTKSFDIIKQNLTADKLLRIPYLEFVAILVKLSEFQYSAKYLLDNLPRVMNKLLQGANVVEPDSYALRKDTIENLAQYPDQDLNVWREPLKDEYYKLIHGKPAQVQALVHDGAL